MSLESLYNHWWIDNQDNILNNLCRLINIKTLTPNENAAYPFLKKNLKKIGFKVKEETGNPDLKKYQYYSRHPLSRMSRGHSNLRCFLPIKKFDRKILFSCHVDVVPAQEGYVQAFQSKIAGGRIYGRGSCDNKNNIVMIMEAVRFIKKMKIGFNKKIYFDITSEEEIGGNGALATIFNGIEADEVIVLEPTDLKVHCGHRGCITFCITVNGSPTHMGNPRDGISAIDGAIEIIRQLKIFEKQLLEEAKRDPYFNIYDYPLTLNIGKINGGEWEGSIPKKCNIIGNLGFIHKYSIKETQNKLFLYLKESCPQTVSDSFKITYPGILNDAYVMERNSLLLKRFLVILHKNDIDQKKIYAWNVSCDARLYYKISKLPTIIFGCGSLKDAHSNNEKLKIKQLKRGIKIIVDYILSDTAPKALQPG